MSTSFAHLPIVTDGLIFSIDPYNKKSYVSGDTSIYGLTKDIPLGTLENGVTFDIKSLSLDGTNQNISINTGFGVNPPPFPMTFDIWVNVSSVTTLGGLLQLNNTDTAYYGVSVLQASNGRVQLSVFDGLGSGVGNRRSLTTPNNSLPYDEWVHISCIYRNPTSGYDMTCYVNLVDYGGSNSGAGGAVGWDSISSSRTDIGKITSFPAASLYSEMLVSPIKVYNRELSFEEIKQNYNALKGRFINYGTQ